MDDKDKKSKDKLVDEQKRGELSEKKLDDVTGGSAFADVPRVPPNDYDDDIKNKA